ncbi:ABC transporter substrate-binding protein [Marinobacterium rhizophilum]|uniref:ABC transporter substrate-binding protein n=1 Tax=Marinobacterium rhizophilum TaxID=420402 RepID=UPI0003734CC9|nr:ABC transporter substrate-binding protein [Marinobacterium rhizophilum]
MVERVGFKPLPSRTEPLPGRRRFLENAGMLAAASVLPWSSGAVQAAGDEVLHVGIMGPFSGPARGTGRDIRQGALMALDDARAEGEIPVRIQGRLQEVEPVWIDSQSNPATASAAVTEAFSRYPITLMVGGWHSAVALSVMDIETEYGVMHLNLGSAQAIADKINHDPLKYRFWFKGWPSPARLNPLYRDPLNHFRQQGLWTPASLKVAIAAEDTPWGQSWGEAMRSTLKGMGFDPLAVDLMRLDQTDYYELLQRYRQEKVALVAFTNTGNLAATSFVRQFREVGVEALLVADSLRGSSDWYEQSGEASNYIISMDAAMPIALWQRWWVRRYQTRFGHYPNIAAAGLQYDYTRMAIRILNNAASLDLEKLISTAYRSPYRGIWHHYRFARGPGPRAVSANEVMTGRFMEGFYFPMVQLFNGESKIIWPLKYADQRFQAPPWLMARG